MGLTRAAADFGCGGFFFFFLLLLGVEADIGCSVCLRKEILELGYGFV